jgi:ubiquinone/menaquinone biosynthesis C-methylase UbiE
LPFNSKHFKDEEVFLFDKITKEKLSTIKILEVGAGNGRIIGLLSTHFINGCYSIDINKELSNYVKNKYPIIKTFVGEIINLPFKDKEFDLVYTHEVLQHICPEEIEKACEELKRVGKEVWCLENWRDTEDGAKVSDSHNGRWNYDLKKRFSV